jgi:4-methylaminobutanoate oxidase (formaldehyde-forming)
VYTQWLDERGMLQADLTVTRLAQDKYMVVATDTQHRHVEAWMKKRLDEATTWATVTDVTGGYAFFNLQGPRSRELLQSLTSADLGGDAFGFGDVREIDVGYCRFNAARITYCGELGYELYVPTEFAVHVYDELMGHSSPPAHVGLKALSSLRLEKGYRDYGHDMDNTDTIYDVGLSFTCDFDKPGGFLGKEAVVAEKARNKERGGRSKRLASVSVSADGCFLHHGDVVERNGKPVGELRAATRGWTVADGGGIGLVMVEAEADEIINMKWIREGEWTVRCGNNVYAVDKVTFKPLYDPKNERIKA